MVVIDDFYTLLPKHAFIFRPTGELWPAISVDRSLGCIDGMKATEWLCRHRAVLSVVKHPGEATYEPETGGAK